MIPTIYVFDCETADGEITELAIPHNQIASIELVSEDRYYSAFKVNNYLVRGSYNKFLDLFVDNGGYVIKHFHDKLV